jgi:hypothetical protein
MAHARAAVYDSGFPICPGVPAGDHATGSGTNAAVTATMAAVADARNFVSALTCGLDDATTAGLLTVTGILGESIVIPFKGSYVLPIAAPLAGSAANTAIAATVGAVSGRTGYVTLLGFAAKVQPGG